MTHVDGREEPAFFTDLNLDQIVASITADRQEYDLVPFFHTPLQSIATIAYRQEVFRDLEGEALFGNVSSFAQEMRTMRTHLARAAKLRYKYQKESWFLDAADIYCDAVTRLITDMTLADIQSRGLRAFREYLASYVESSDFTSLLAETKKLKRDLLEIRYCLRIKGNRITVRAYDSEADYSADVEETFDKFKQGAVKDYLVNFSTAPDMNHVEARIVELVARLCPAVFLALDAFRERHGTYLDETVRAFDREVQFYVAYLEYIARLRAGGLRFCYPHISDQSKEVYSYEAFDIALANKLVQEKSAVVCNDWYLEDPERIVVVSGPNQGGKTTFARMIGQLHYLASIGCLVPGREARLFLFDRLFAHFEREEDLTTLSGKLADDLLRLHEILDQATGNSIIIMNESLTATTLRDAHFLGKKVLEQIVQLDLLCVYVTFVDELASLGQTIVSMTSMVDPQNAAVRTYRIVRRPADGLAYAAAIAEKYGLTYERLRGRITS